MKNISLLSIFIVLLSGCVANQTPPNKDNEDNISKNTPIQKLTKKEREKAKADDRGHRSMPMTEARFNTLLADYSTNDDKEVSWHEYNVWRLARFNKTDANNNGTVDPEEYVYEFENRLDSRYEQGRTAHIKQTTQRFNALDKNNDSNITWVELEESGNKIFARWDTNKDGTINNADPKPNYGKKKSSRQTSSPISFIRMPTTHSRKGLMKIYDANKDNAVTKEEFNNERRSSFYLTDINKDNKLNSEEYHAEFEDRLDTTIATSRRANIKQTYVRFDVLDDNKDNKMTFAELQISGKRIFTRWDKNSDGTITTADIGK